jgi:hypothetical protein
MDKLPFLLEAGSARLLPEMTRGILLALTFLSPAACACAGSPSGMDPNTVYSAAHDLESKIGLAQADLKACKEDKTKCDPVDKDLSEALQTTQGLEKQATGAGAKP